MAQFNDAGPNARVNKRRSVLHALAVSTGMAMSVATNGHFRPALATVSTPKTTSAAPAARTAARALESL